MASPSPPAADSARGRWALALGAAAGLLAAAVGLMQGSAQSVGLPEDAVAAVNGEILRVSEYERALAALASDRREPLGDRERQHVLDRLVDEELLVQRGLELGMARHDRRVRGDLVAAVIQAVVAQTEGYEPDAEELEAFYGENRGYFSRSGRARVRRVLVRGAPARDAAEARTRVEEVETRLRDGESFATVQQALGDSQVAPVPFDYLPSQKLREYLGPAATRAVLALEPGGVTSPLRSGTGWQVMELVDRVPGFTPPLAEIEKQVRAELVRRAGDDALRDYLEELRLRADVRIGHTPP